MSFAYNNPNAHRLVVDLGDAEDVEGLFDTLSNAVGKVAGASSTVSNVVSAGSRVVNQARQALAPSRATPPPRPAVAPRPAPRPAPPRKVPPRMAVPARMRTLSSPASATPEREVEAPGMSPIVPLAIGAAALVGGGAWWFLSRKGGDNASHR